MHGYFAFTRHRAAMGVGILHWRLGPHGETAPLAPLVGAPCTSSRRPCTTWRQVVAIRRQGPMLRRRRRLFDSGPTLELWRLLHERLLRRLPLSSLPLHFGTFCTELLLYIKEAPLVHTRYVMVMHLHTLLPLASAAPLVPPSSSLCPEL